jgi:hypothetical protein
METLLVLQCSRRLKPLLFYSQTLRWFPRFVASRR